MKIYQLSLAMGIVLALTPTFLSAQDATRASHTTATVFPAAEMDVRMGLPPVDTNYSIGVSDVLTIDVWKQPEISRTLPVRTDGKISLPLLNDVQAAGLTPSKLGAEIADGLRKVMVNPQVTVMVSEINSQRIFIVGQVQRGGSYPLIPGLTLVQALSSSGFTPFANLKKIYIVRVENGRKQIVPANFKDAVSRNNLQQDPPLKPGDTIVVP